MSHEILFYFIYKCIWKRGWYNFFFFRYISVLHIMKFMRRQKKNLNGKGNTVKIHTIKNVGTCFVVFVGNILMVDFFFYILYLSNSLLIKCAGRIFKQQKKNKNIFFIESWGME